MISCVGIAIQKKHCESNKIKNHSEQPEKREGAVTEWCRDINLETTRLNIT